MHCRLELLLPPGSTKEDVEPAMQFLSEYEPAGWDEDAGHPEWVGPRRGVYDYFVIGGRWTGAHAEAHYSEDDMSRFRRLLQGREVKVSRVRMGKPTLTSHKPEEIDGWWREMFPDGPLSRCPIFDYASFADVDAMPVAKLHPEDSAEMVYIVGPPEQYRHRHFLRTSTWNGMNWQKSAWDGKIASAIESHNALLDGATEEYRAPRLVTGEWVAFTVDCHT